MSCAFCGGKLDGRAVNACVECGTVCADDGLVQQVAVVPHDGMDQLFLSNIGRIRIDGGLRNSLMHDVRKSTAWTQGCNRRTRMLCNGFDMIEALAQQLDIPSATCALARHTFVRITQLGGLSKMRRRHLIGGALHFSLKTDSVCRSIHDLAHGLQIKCKCIQEVCDKITGVNVCADPVQNSAQLFVPGICIKLNLNRTVIRRCTECLDKLEQEYELPFKPKSLAAGSIALVTGGGTSRKSIARAASVSYDTLTRCLNYLRMHESFRRLL